VHSLTERSVPWDGATPGLPPGLAPLSHRVRNAAMTGHPETAPKLRSDPMGWESKSTCTLRKNDCATH